LALACVQLLFHSIFLGAFAKLRKVTISFLISIQINHQPDATISLVYYPDVYLQLNMFRAPSRPSSEAQQLQ